MSENESLGYRPVNQILGAQPSFGPIPAEQLVPWALISFIIFFLSRNVFNLDWMWTVLLMFWGCGTWWILTGSKPWKFLSLFVRTPRWTTTKVLYRSLYAAAPRRSIKGNR